MKQFILKTGGIVMLLATMLLIENFVLGFLPFLGALALIPAAGMISLRLLRAGIEKPKKRRSTASRATASTTSRPAPLRVASPSTSPRGPKAA